MIFLAASKLCLFRNIPCNMVFIPLSIKSHLSATIGLTDLHWGDSKEEEKRWIILHEEVSSCRLAAMFTAQ